MSNLCIVGAGIAAAGAADVLRDSDVEVTVLEKSRGVGGRAATRRKHDCRYDHGANYVKDVDDRTTDLIYELGTDGLVDVEEPVWTFDAAGEVRPGDERDERKWAWEAGITQFAKRLFERSDATVHTQTRVERLAREDALDSPTGGRWTLADTDGETWGPFDAVLLTPPAPQTADLLSVTDWQDASCAKLRDAVSDVSFRTIRTIVLDYDFSLDVPWYALVDTSKDHDIGWLSREECKAGHVPEGEGLLVVQMSPNWSTGHYDDPLDEVAPVVAEMAADLVGDDRLTDFQWADDQGWAYALPDSKVKQRRAKAGERGGLYVAGDWVAGEGRVHEALWSGREVAERIEQSSP
jgi:renalase